MLGIPRALHLVWLPVRSETGCWRVCIICGPVSGHRAEPGLQALLVGINRLLSWSILARVPEGASVLPSRPRLLWSLRITGNSPRTLCGYLGRKDIKTCHPCTVLKTLFGVLDDILIFRFGGHPGFMLRFPAKTDKVAAGSWILLSSYRAMCGNAVYRSFCLVG